MASAPTMPRVSHHMCVNRSPAPTASQDSRRQTGQDRPAGKDDTATSETDNETPEENLEKAYQSIRSDLTGELLARIKNNTPKFFENLVVDLMIALGYGGSRSDAGRSIGQSGDEGIDGIIKEDRLGLDVIYLQAKRCDGVCPLRHDPTP